MTGSGSPAAGGLLLLVTPGCWLWHPEVVEELLWLRGAWLFVYANPDAPPSAAGDWHDRQRPGVVRRIRDYAGMCSVEAHQPGHDQHTPARPVPLADAVEQVARWWGTGRTGLPPAPTAEQLATATTATRTAWGRA